MPQQAELLVMYCKASDFDAVTHTCTAPFFGAAPSLVPRLSAAEGLELSIAIIGCWAIGFMVKQARHVTST
ncbi:hypothetical protein CO613_11450 [Lysobacteraceae bacterium NML07-0707]|nr:hypothetical protein CO613_11450 [Xanthomonadaceae bacterium NML07-0707]